MQPILNLPRVDRRRLLPLAILVCSLIIAFRTHAQPGAGAPTGIISGIVSNHGTGNHLEGARVEVPALGLSALTDNTGRFVLAGIPTGTYDVAASYIGLDPTRESVTITAGQRAVHNFDLNSSIYKLDQFKVTGEREGGAAAITAQRNADNVKNVVAMDSFGNLPNMSAGELAVRLPGVAGNLDDEGNVTGLTVRGMGPTLNRVTVDGGLISNVGGLNRQFQTHSLTGAMFEELEVIKGHTPDQDADSLGGTINLKTRSPLSMKEKRRFAYSFGGRWAPSFTSQDPLRRDHASHPILNFTYQEVFSVLGGERNLGIAVSTFYSENVAGYFRTIRDFQNTTASPAYLWDYRTQDAFNNRKQSAVNVKVDYRLSPSTKLSFNAVYNDAFEPFNRLYEARAFTSQTVATIGANGQPTGTGAILPNFTDKITQVRGVAASDMQITETMFSFMNRTRLVDLGVVQDFGRLHLDYDANYSQTHNNLGVGNGGTLSIDNTGVGWILDRTQSDLYPKFTQTEGPGISDISNYRVGQLTTRNGKRNVEIADFKGNARYDLPTSFRLSLKAGGEWRRQKAGEVGGNRRWNYISTKPLVADPTIGAQDREKTGRVLPYFETAALIQDNHPVDPTLWSEDIYFREQSRYTGTRDVVEEVTAGYVMAKGKVSKLGYIAGVRTERTEDESFGWVRTHFPSSAAQQAADPIGSATRDYANTARTINGDYSKWFPSAHLTYDFTSNLKSHVSWSKSFARPVFTNLLPNETVNDTAQTLTTNNPSLKPQLATNWDATLEYYFEPVGMVSVGWFQKTIKDYIVTGINGGTVATGANNGYNGEYAGYTTLTASNAGTAYVQGWELSYQQQFTFLPGFLKGLGASANFTYLRTHGDFGGTSYLTTNQVQGFIPQTGNLNLAYKYRAFSTRVSVNYTGRYINAYSAATPARNQYRYARTILNAGVAWQFRPEASLVLDVSNLTNEPQEFYRFITSQMERTILDGTTITLGVSGRF